MFRVDKERHEYWDGPQKIVSITDCLKSAGLIEARFASDFDMWVGTATHRALELHIKGTLDYKTLDAVLKPRIEAWEDFVQKTGFAVADSELPLYSKILGFAGTLDLRGYFPDGEEGIVEIKSGNVARWAGIQLAGQDTLLGFGKHRKRYGLKIPADGPPCITPFTDPDDYSIFLSALNIARWKLKS